MPVSACAESRFELLGSNYRRSVVCLTYALDMTTTRRAPIQDLARKVYPAVEHAQRMMMTATTVPNEVAELIDTVADTLGDSYAAWGSEGVDPYLGQILLAATLAGEKGLRDPNVDMQRRRVRLALERLRQTLRDIVDEAPADEDSSSKEVLQWLAEVLSVSQSELASLLGVSTRTLQRWLAESGPSPEGEDEMRVRMVARTVAHLRHVFTGPGVLRWFERPHPDLADRPPRELLQDPLRLPQLTRLASRSRSSIAT